MNKFLSRLWEGYKNVALAFSGYEYLDACSVCGGLKGGVPGNENVIDGVVMCDYCHAERMLAKQKTREIVINPSFGGFNLSPQGLATYCDLRGIPCFWFRQINRGRREPEEYEPIALWTEADNRFTDYAFTTDDVELIKQAWGTYHIWDHNIERDDPALVETVKLLGSYASDGDALTIVSIPADVEWEIEEYDGSEWVAEKHRTWR